MKSLKLIMVETYVMKEKTVKLPAFPFRSQTNQHLTLATSFPAEMKGSDVHPSMPRVISVAHLFFPSSDRAKHAR